MEATRRDLSGNTAAVIKDESVFPGAFSACIKMGCTLSVPLESENDWINVTVIFRGISDSAKVEKAAHFVRLFLQARSTGTPTATIDTSTWPKPIDCSGGTPPPEHLTFCKVAGQAQVQVYEACKAAALGSLWASSPQHTYGAKDSNLNADTETCARGSGLRVDANADVMGWPREGKPSGELQYIFVRGTEAAGIFEHVFNAIGTGSDLGFVAFDEDSLIEKIGDLYMSFGGGE